MFHSLAVSLLCVLSDGCLAFDVPRLHSSFSRPFLIHMFALLFLVVFVLKDSEIVEKYRDEFKNHLGIRPIEPAHFEGPMRQPQTACSLHLSSDACCLLFASLNVLLFIVCLLTYLIDFCGLISFPSRLPFFLLFD